jgi:integrase
VFILSIIVTDLLVRGAFIMENLEQFEQASIAANVTVRRHGPVKGYRPREYLTEREIEQLMKAASDNRWGHRDATAMLIAYRHGLRASEVVALRWDDIDLATGRLHVRRAKGGVPSVHPTGAKESRALRRLQRETQTSSPYVFISERGAPRGRVSAHDCASR